MLGMDCERLDVALRSNSNDPRTSPGKHSVTYGLTKWSCCMFVGVAFSVRYLRRNVVPNDRPTRIILGSVIYSRCLSNRIFQAT